MTKQEILDYFSLIDFAYNESGRFESLSRMIDDLLKEQEAVEPICQIIFDAPYYFCGSCKAMLNMYATKAKYCSRCGRPVKWK